MVNNNDTTKRTEELLNVSDEIAFSVSEIDRFVRDEKVLSEYENKYKGKFYSALLLSLTHESFSEDQALALWNEIIRHLEKLNDILGRNVGIAVASLDYLSNIKDELSEPKIIEEDMSESIADSATTDSLTTLFLRDVFDIVLRKEVEKSNRTKSPLCLLLIDIDDFKEVNDTHGHLMGDKVLGKLGIGIKNSVRKMDFASRYGGEEMAIIMPNADLDLGYQAAERIREVVEALKFNGFGITVSIGVSEKTDRINTPEKLIKAADDALYEAKRMGKNQTRKATGFTAGGK